MGLMSQSMTTSTRYDCLDSNRTVYRHSHNLFSDVIWSLIHLYLYIFATDEVFCFIAGHSADKNPIRLESWLLHNAVGQVLRLRSKSVPAAVIRRFDNSEYCGYLLSYWTNATPTSDSLLIGRIGKRLDSRRHISRARQSPKHWPARNGCGTLKLLTQVDGRRTRAVVFVKHNAPILCNFELQNMTLSQFWIGKFGLIAAVTAAPSQRRKRLKILVFIRQPGSVTMRR